MRIHLKEREHYEDLYDSFTVDTCRHMRFSNKEIPDEEFLGQDLSEEQIKALKDIKGGWIDVVREIGTFCYAAERYKDKSEAIDEWMKKDREKDERLAKLEPPRHVRCRECLSTNLRLESKDEYWGSPRSKQERLLCMYMCADCETRSAFFDDGEEFKRAPSRPMNLADLPSAPPTGLEVPDVDSESDEQSRATVPLSSSALGAAELASEAATSLASASIPPAPVVEPAPEPAVATSPGPAPVVEPVLRARRR